MLEFNQYQESDKAPFIIYPDLECIIEKTDGCKTKEQQESYQMQKSVIFVKKNLKINI